MLTSALRARPPRLEKVRPDPCFRYDALHHLAMFNKIRNWRIRRIVARHPIAESLWQDALQRCTPGRRLGASDQAVLAYQQALARDARFVEARYNLAQALEAAGKLDAAGTELDRVLDADPNHADALFNLAQLRMKAGEMRAAKALYERYLALDPPDAWAATARKAIIYCAASLPV